MLFKTRYFVCGRAIPLELLEENPLEDVKKYFLCDDIIHNDVHIMEYQKPKEPKKYKFREDNYSNLKNKKVSNRIEKGIVKSLAGFVKRYSHCTKIVMDVNHPDTRVIIEKYDNGVNLIKLTSNLELEDMPDLEELLYNMDAGEFHCDYNVKYIEELTSQPARINSDNMEVEIIAVEPRFKLY